ncbi:MAG: helix-turn-helix domain-containing protein [Acidimicrobiales bacterium]|nr:helix-turn-helix domain-containing protein [Acidimicrobiales bacterium]
MASGETVGLQEAADHLGVHYQTAYQWVRRGDLPARQVSRKYAIDLGDLDAFQRVRNTPTPPTRRIPRGGFGLALPRFHAALVSGDEVTARRVTARYADTGTPIIDIIEGLFAPALRQIGDDWADGCTTVATEHLASTITQRLLAAYQPSRRGRPRGRALTTTPTGERHGLGASMAAAVLKEAGWKVHHLGADLPTEEVAEFANHYDIGVVVLTSATDQGRSTARAMIAELAVSGITAITNEPGANLHDLTEAVEAVR